MNLERAIASAAAWFGTAHLAAPWRSEELRPREPLLSDKKRPSAAPYRAQQESVEERRARLVEDVVVRRLALAGSTAPSSSNGGRVLASWGCNYSLWSGEAQTVSERFFDDLDLPPWDLWLAYEIPPGRQLYAGHALLAWVPDVLIEIAQRGIESAPGDCISWLDSG